MLDDIAAALVGHVTTRRRVLFIGAAIVAFWMLVMDGPPAVEWYADKLFGPGELPFPT